MLKRLCALSLALVMVLILPACGRKQEGDGGRYASDQPMDVFAAVEAIHALKDFTFELRVSTVDPESAQTGELRYTVTGECHSDAKQTSARWTLPDGTELTTLMLDGSELYADLGTAASALSKGFQEQGSELYVQDMEGARKRLKEDWVHISLREDPWTAVESGRLSGSRERLAKLYKKVKQTNARRVRMEEHVGKLSLGLGDLQGTLLDITDELSVHKSLYMGELGTLLQEDFGAVIDQSGMDAEGLLNEKWFVIQQTGEELAQLQSAGDINGWTARLLACGEEAHGYSLDLTVCFDQSANLCLSVYPAAPRELSAPKGFVEVGDVAGSAYLVYSGAKMYLESLGQTQTGEEEALTDEEAQQLLGLDEDESYVPVSTQSPEDGSGLLTADVYTSDGGVRRVPLLPEYESLRSEDGGDRPTDVSESSGGYVLEYVTIKKRDLAEAAAENARLYATEFKETWGYDIVREPTDCVVSPAGDVAAAGMAYHDLDSGQDVTVITCCLNVENSSEMLYFDLFTYSKSITDKEIRAIGALMASLGVEQPLEIIKN